jgi:hypothetical protein
MLCVHILYFNVASHLFDLVAYIHREVLVVSFLALYPRVGGMFPLIISYSQKAEIIINAIGTFWMGMIFPFSIIGQSANCSPNLVAEYLAVSDDFVEKFFCQSRFQ